MDEKDIRHLLHNLRVPIGRPTYTGSVKHTRWMNISCPFAAFTHDKKTDAHPSFGVTIKPDGVSAYRCFSCGMKGRLSSLPTRLGGYVKRDYGPLRIWAQSVEAQSQANRPVPKWEDADPVTIDYSETGEKPLPDPSMRLTFPMAYLGATHYLAKRGVRFADTMLLDLRYDDYQKRVLFPVYDPYDRFAGFTGRSVLNRKEWTKEVPKVRDYYGLNKRKLLLKLPHKRAGIKLIGEGLFDFANFVRHGYPNSRAILGTALTEEKIEILVAEGEPAYFFMDNDKAGWQATFGVPKPDNTLDTSQAWAYRLYKEIPVWIVPYPSIPLDGSDPGSIDSKSLLDECVSRAWLFTGKAPFTPSGDHTFRQPRKRKP